jgi:3',5'-cyclic AMP phosphodiesterase CpdA
MKLYALSDLHLGYEANRDAVATIPEHPEDVLILAGDLGEKTDHLEWAFRTLGPKWGRLIWVPGNHELWTPPSEGPTGLRGVDRYQAMCDTCEAYGVIHPESEWPTWPDDPDLVICPMFLLYDYSWSPPGSSPAQAVAWAREARQVARDEDLLHPHPFRTREDWCHDRIERTAARLDALGGRPTVLINHWPLRLDLVRLFRIPRFIPWCGTQATHDWHLRYNARVVISGHLHMRATDWRDGVRFEEVSLGYPRHWREEVGAHGYLRPVLPGPDAPPQPHFGPIWHR